MVINSVKGITGVTQSAAFIPPTTLDFSAWGPTWEILREPMFRTLFFVVQSSIISAVIGAINGFVFAKWRFRGSNFRLYNIPLRNVHPIPSDHDSTY